MKRHLFCFYFLLNIFPVFAQTLDNGWLAHLNKQLQNYWQQQPEKLYIHTDRAVYASADTVWFKAYLADPGTNTLHQVPEIIYLNLISEKNEILISQRLQTEGGLKAGNLILPDTLRAGNYLLQGYTNWQRNKGSGLFFRKELFVNKVPPTETVGNSGLKVLQEIVFTPEGGQLLAGFENKVGFKGIAANSSAMPVEGKILDESGKTITTFRSNNNGLGSFYFRPEPGKMYRAQVINGQVKKEFPLPVAAKGYALQVKKSPDSVSINIKGSEINAQPIFLVLQSQGKRISSDTIKLNTGNLRKRTFATRNLPAGIVQATLFSAEGTPLNDRLFFNHPASPVTVKFDAAKKVYSRREPVQLTIALKDAAGNPVETALSVAITNNLPGKGPSLKNEMLLPAEISGINTSVINKPEMLDDLLLTHHPADYSWNAITTYNARTPVFPRETALNRVGQVTGNGAAIGRAVIYLLETNTGETHLATSDPEGRFKLPLSGNRFFYQVWQNGVWQEAARLQLVSAGLGPETENWTVTTGIDSVLTRQLNLRRQIDAVYFREAETPKFSLVNREMWPAYPADKYYPLAEYNELTNMEEILQEMVPSVRVISRKKKVQANMYDEDRRTFFLHQPLYIIDGQPTWNNDLFLRLDASQLEQVNIYNSAKSLKNFGYMGNQGVIVVFTKSRNYQNPDLATENILTVPGQQAEAVYKPIERAANTPDFRPVLYWNPNVKTNTNGQATLNFRTTDETGSLKVKVEGITKDGSLISEEFIVPVQSGE